MEYPSCPINAAMHPPPIVLGCFLTSYPYSPPRNAPVYSFLSALVYHEVARRRLYYAFAAIMAHPVLKKPLRSSFAQYLGRISYSLYLVHGVLIRVIGGRILHWTCTLTGMSEASTFNAGFGLATLLFVPIVIWAADLFEKWVDRPCIKFTKMVESKAVCHMPHEPR